MPQNTKKIEVSVKRINFEFCLVDVTLVEAGKAPLLGQFLMTEEQLKFLNAVRAFTQTWDTGHGTVTSFKDSRT